jgi:hypothetical protein
VGSHHGTVALRPRASLAARLCVYPGWMVSSNSPVALER